MNSVKAKLLLVDDDPDLLRLLSIRLQGAGYAVSAVESAEAALSQVSVSCPDVVITDLRMGGMDGMALFESLQKKHPALPVVILTAHGTIPDAVAATQRGVFGYLTKPFEGKALIDQVEKALQFGGTPAANGITDTSWRADIITRSPEMEAILAKARLVAGSDASVMIFGESGAGKEMLSRAIHKASARQAAVRCRQLRCDSRAAARVRIVRSRERRFHRLRHPTTRDCSRRRSRHGVPRRDRRHAAAAASEAAALSCRSVRCARSAHAIGEGRCANHLGNSSQSREAIKAGTFREDLYYRLHVVSLALPSLSQRREDIPVLANHFLKNLAARYGKTLNGFAQDAMEVLIRHTWPGNVRELYNVVEQAVALATTPIISPGLLESAIRGEMGDLSSFESARFDFERDYLAKLLKITNGNVTQAARLAKRNRTEFYKLLQRHHLNPTMFKPIAQAQRTA
jgi:two-component system response regulator GlrR